MLQKTQPGPRGPHYIQPTRWMNGMISVHPHSLGATVSSPVPTFIRKPGVEWPDSRQVAGRPPEYPRQIPLLPTGYLTAVRRLGANIRRYITLGLWSKRTSLHQAPCTVHGSAAYFNRRTLIIPCSLLLCTGPACREMTWWPLSGPAGPFFGLIVNNYSKVVLSS